MTLNAVKVKDDFKLGFNPTSRLTLLCSPSPSPPLVVLHWKNKLVVLTTEWLPQLQTSWRDCGY